jgi:nucleotide-binding universal stress UspA family protein
MRGSEKDKVIVRKILVPVDGSEHALQAVRYVITLVREGRPCDVHLLNVQPPLMGDVTAFVSHRAVRDFHLEEARNAGRRARELLDRAGVAYAMHIVIGYAAEAIAECARDLRCTQVIMGTHGFGKITHWLIGSVTRETIHLIDPMIPVTLVKAGPAHTVRLPALWRPGLS